jgi:lactate dehydrogenase-like 2-hydroxyacid dehydrogenase
MCHREKHPPHYDSHQVTYCNSISVSEHVVMMILGLVRNYIPSYKQVVDGGWNIADCVSRAYDVEGEKGGMDLNFVFLFPDIR